MVCTDCDFRITYVNRAGQELFGYSSEELLGKFPDILNAEPDAKERQAELYHAIAAGESFSATWLNRRKNGSTFMCEFSVTAIRGDDGEVCGYVGAQRDVTERTRAEEEIKELSGFPAENPNPVLRIGGDGLVLHANEASAPLLDHWACEVGRPCPEHWREAVADVLGSGSSVTEEIECGDRTLLLTVAPITESGYVNVYGLDITDRRELEGRLREASKMEALGTLAGGIAHEFNNMLMAIVSYAHLGAKRAQNADVKQALARIREVADQGAGVIRQLLALGRKQALTLRVIDLCELLTDTCELLRPLLTESIDLRFVPAPDLGHIRGDADSIRQVVMNLAFNARDAMPGRGTLTIEADNTHLDREYAAGHPDIKAGPYVSIAVTDTGCGMDEVSLGRAFEPFYTTKAVGKGTGLGLAAVHGILRQLGGYIRVESELGKGTVVRVYLPRADEEPEKLPDDDAQAGPAGAGRETVLVVEDNETVRDAVRGVLEESGYTVLCAANADDAELAFTRQHHKIALVLTDVVMPGRTGYELGRRLTAQRPALKIIYMSGHDDNTAARGAPDPGTVLLRKPIDPEELPLRVREVLDADAAVAGRPDPPMG